MLNDQVSVDEIQQTLPVERNKGGRPLGSTKLQPDEDTVKKIKGLAKIQCTQAEAAAVLGVNVKTFSAFLEAHENVREVWESGKEAGKASLRRQQFKMAKTNPTMAIWLGKQVLDQSDKADFNHNIGLTAQFEDFIRDLHAQKGMKTIEHEQSCSNGSREIPSEYPASPAE